MRITKTLVEYRIENRSNLQNFNEILDFLNKQSQKFLLLSLDDIKKIIVNEFQLVATEINFSWEDGDINKKQIITIII